MQHGKHHPDIMLNAGEVAEWLLRHPMFLHQHPDVLEVLDIPCVTPAGTVSLIQHKLRLLDGQLQQEHDQIQALQARGALNRQQLQEVMRVLAGLVAEQEPAALMSGFMEGLKRHFHADQAHFHLFTDAPAAAAPIAGLRRDRAHGQMRNLFAQLFNVGKPLCGSLSEAYLRILFGERAGAIRSTLLVPVCRSWEGLLVLGSESGDRYQQGLLLDLLSGLTGVVAARIEDILGLATEHGHADA